MTSINELEERIRRLEAKMGRTTMPGGVNKKITTIEAKLSKLSGLVRPWKSWTPTLSYAGGTTNPTSATKVFAKYYQVGKLVIVQIYYTYVRGSGDRTITTFTLPVTAAADRMSGAASETLRVSSTAPCSVYTTDSGTKLSVFHGTMTRDGFVSVTLSYRV
jgi:hypothetical protein